MTRFALTKTTPLLLGMLALAACPGDETPIDTEGTSTGDDTTSMGPTTMPMTTTVDPDSGSGSGDASSGSSSSSSSGGDVCDPACEAGECCLAGSCFSAPPPTCEGGCPEGEVCACPEGMDPCDCVGECIPPVCPLPPIDGNYADCLDDMGVTSDEPCAGAGCVVDNEGAPTAAVCVASGCDNVCQCPAAPDTGDAPVNCEDVTGDMVNDCWLACDAGQTCPDGMTCFGGFICLFSNIPSTDVPLFGDCVNVPGATCTDGFCVAAPDGGVCTAPCADAGECVPAPGTGDAVVTCSDVTGDMMDECWLSCEMGETCPDGMECFGGFVCIWPEVPPPPPPGDAYGDCLNAPGSCSADEDACLYDDAAMPTTGVCTETGCADATDCSAAPATGDAVVTCDDLGDDNTCYLDCAGGQTCPDGMACTDVGMGMTSGSACMWPAAAFLLQEDFESGALGAGWTVIDVDGNTPNAAVAFVNDAFVVTDEFEPAMNFGAYSTSWYTPAGASDDWLVTPQITLGAATSVAWEGWAPDGTYPDGYELRISTGMPTVMGFMANPALFTIADEGQMFTGHVVDLAAAGYANQDVYLAWRNNSNDEFILVIDNVSVYDVP